MNLEHTLLQEVGDNMKRKIQAFLLASTLASTTLLASPRVDAGPNSPYINKESEGTFIKYEDNLIYFKEYDGTLHAINFDGRTNFFIDERIVTIDDFKNGMDIYVKLQGRKIVHMDSFSTDFPAYITPGSKQRTGIVKKIDRDQIIITTAIGTEETYFTSPSTITLQNGENISLNRLYVGDRVKLYFDDIDTTTASKIVIEGESIEIKDLYKGEIAVTNRMSSIITINNVKVFRNGNWQDKGTIRLPYNSDLPLYVSGQKIDYRNIENYRGKTVYIALKDFFGKDSAEKMVIKNQYETTFSDKIESVNWYTSQIELTNKKNINFHDGTMVIRNGRLVDTSSIVPNASALVVADGRGEERTADVIYIYDEDINNSNIGMDRIYAGRVDKLTDYRLFLKDFFVLEQNRWESFAETKELSFDNDTFIYDLENPNEDERQLTAKEFLDGEYHIDENNMSDIDKEKGTKDYNAYIYTDGDRISGIYLMKKMDSLLKQTITTATIKEGPKDDVNMGLTLVLRDAKNWSESTEKWNVAYGDMNLRIKDALIVKDGKGIKSSELKQGDRLYVVRDDLVGKVIVVK